MKKMQEIDPSVAIRRALTVLLCIICVMGIIFWAAISQAFTFKIENNVNQQVSYLLYIDESNIASGMIEALEVKTLPSKYNPDTYHIVWADPAEEWGSLATFEIPDTVTDGQTVTVSLDFVPLKITIIK